MSEVKPLLIEIGCEVEAGALTQCEVTHCVRRLRVRHGCRTGKCTREGLCRD